MAADMALQKRSNTKCYPLDIYLDIYWCVCMYNICIICVFTYVHNCMETWMLVINVAPVKSNPSFTTHQAPIEQCWYSWTWDSCNKWGTCLTGQGPTNEVFEHPWDPFMGRWFHHGQFHPHVGLFWELVKPFPQCYTPLSSGGPLCFSDKCFKQKWSQVSRGLLLLCLSTQLPWQGNQGKNDWSLILMKIL